MTDYPQLAQNISCSLPICGFTSQAWHNLRLSQSGWAWQNPPSPPPSCSLNLPRWRHVSWTVQSPERNLPRWTPKSWMVPSQKTEPSTIMHRIVDGPWCQGEPSTLESVIVEGSIFQDLTIHAKRPLSRTVQDHRNVHRRLLYPVEISRFRRKCRFFAKKVQKNLQSQKKCVYLQSVWETTMAKANGWLGGFEIIDNVERE